MAIFATAALCFLLSGCTHAAAPGAPAATHKTMTLTLPRAATADETVHVRLAAGVLPQGARIVVRLPNGEIAGSATPYGFRGAKAGVFTIPLPPGAIRDGKVTLELAVEEKGALRAPKDGEVERVDLVYVPVTR
jgi:hypothetical protein